MKKPKLSTQKTEVSPLLAQYLFIYLLSKDIRGKMREAELDLKKSQRKDYYKILGLQKNATDAEVKKAYKKLALRYHPGMFLDSFPWHSPPP